MMAASILLPAFGPCGAIAGPLEPAYVPLTSIRVTGNP